MRKRLRALFVLGAVTALATMALSFGGAASANEGGAVVKIHRVAFYPNLLTVTAGDPVRFDNIDGQQQGVPHSATADDGSFDTGVFYGSRTITAPLVAGEYAYHCVIHPFMHGFLEVQAPPAPPPEPVPAPPAFTG